MTREDGIQKISANIHWDVAVIGGGATGLGIALEAVTRGYKTILLEQSDFAKSTSGKSTKLVHGGVRYLAQGNLRLVREASVERGLLQRNAPHLVKNQTFLIPVYTHWDHLKYTIGLKMYDWISGTLSFGSSVFIPRKKIVNELRNVNEKNLLGVVKYHDGQFDDARLAINLAQTIAAAGGSPLNYMKVTSLLKNEGRIKGLTACDEETHITYTIGAKTVINATGVFVDGIISMDDPSAEKSIRVSQGVHIVIDKKFYPSQHALMIPRTSDGRVLFAVPWHNKVVIGTTDTPVEKALLEPVALEQEISFILDTAGQYLAQKPGRSDVLSVFAGLRPLAAPTEGSKKTKEISRSHRIVVSPSMLFTILGGKWTTYRKMGEDMLDRVEKELHWPHRASATQGLHIHGYTATTTPGPLAFYGSDAAAILALENENKDEWLSESLGIRPAQVSWAVQNEMARTVEDMLSRRTRALLLDARESLRIAPEVAAIMAPLLGKNNDWIQQQLTQYRALASNYILV